MCDRQLSKSCRRLYAAADVKGNLLPGRGLIAESGKNGGRGEVRTTIDKKLQEEVETVMAGYEDDCAVVVIKKSSGDVLAMACTPAFNPNDISGHIARSQNELLNKATQGEYAPGSVFKIRCSCCSTGSRDPCRSEVLLYRIGHIRISGSEM